MKDSSVVVCQTDECSASPAVALLPPLSPTPDADHGAKSTSSTFGCPIPPSVTGMQLSSYPLRAGLVLAARD